MRLTAKKAIAAIGTGAIVASLAVAPAASASAPTASAAAKRPQVCKDGYFHVLHNDKIGSLRLQKGYYKLAVQGKVNCFQAATLLHDFLEYQKPVSGWKIDSGISTPTFVKKGSKSTLFEAAFASAKQPKN